MKTTLIVIILNGLKHIVLGGQKVLVIYRMMAHLLQAIHRHGQMMRVDIYGLCMFILVNVIVTGILLIVMENVVVHLWLIALENVMVMRL